MTEAEAQAVLAAKPAQFARFGLASSPLTPDHGNSSNVWLTPTHALRISSGRFADDHIVLTHGDVHWAHLMWHEQTLTAVLDADAD